MTIYERCARRTCDHLYLDHGGPERAFGCYRCGPSFLTRVAWALRLGRWVHGRSSRCPAYVPPRP